MDRPVLATTTPGLEAVAGDEVASLCGADPERAHRGAVRFRTDAAGLVRLNRYARTLHRTLVVVTEGTATDLGGVTSLVESTPLERYLADGLAFAVRADRRGDQPFGSPDVAEVVGQAVIDRYRAATGHRLPVDLDAPDVVLRAYLRGERFLLVIDATGPSLHDRPWRVRGHDAPIRPTTAAALVRLASPTPGERLLDPMCGSGTVPVEAGLAARGVPVDPDRRYAHESLPFLEATDPDPPDRWELELSGRDDDPDAVATARANAHEAGVSVDLAVADATERLPTADRVVVNPPYGRRVGIDRGLYEGLFRSLDRIDPARTVVLTTRDGLVPHEPDERYPVRLGRLEAAALVFG
jgi:23S rRNA G2445 N2-methylase RlmL